MYLLLSNIIGADVTHASPGVWRPSIAALVASYDKDGARYFSTHSVQGPRMEIIADLEEMLVVGNNLFLLSKRLPL